ncbi:hypothetical protein PHYSODRAFT_336998 [Phytophthora sojae]|uniref:Uncharacterized protein n=1 Tax=Phytophthora sojae (strain P6497) TaxID=1094619 RepID=G4ZXL8_PHYSP|nr:hypothetical protein PHYSODRAFT_336998 [Phytophthora sojae]EGZ12581.1 hypothetical protein PHYSODRAFT_336998 [Phytophthora sojae]|eukprot:XP_009532914.1 hypothetical protein PHYSODRAFT_336998 [Phytophthora sojae]
MAMRLLMHEGAEGGSGSLGGALQLSRADTLGRQRHPALPAAKMVIGRSLICCAVVTAVGPLIKLSASQDVHSAPRAEPDGAEVPAALKDGLAIGAAECQTALTGVTPNEARHKIASTHFGGRSNCTLPHAPIWREWLASGFSSSDQAATNLPGALPLHASECYDGVQLYNIKQKKVKVSNSSFYIKSSTSPNAHWCVLDAMGASAGAAVGAFAGRALLAE